MAHVVNDKEIPDDAKQRIIKNTYRALLTLGMKGCFVYAVDPEQQAYLKQYSTRKQ